MYPLDGAKARIVFLLSCDSAPIGPLARRCDGPPPTQGAMRKRANRQGHSSIVRKIKVGSTIGFGPPFGVAATVALEPNPDIAISNSKIGIRLVEPFARSATF